KEPIHEILLNQTSRGATDASLFLASQLSSGWSGTLLTSGDFQTRNDISHDGWADLAGYGRGLIRPRLFWNGPEGQSASITGGFPYENRTGGTIHGAILPATGQSYKEALESLRYDLGGSYQRVLARRYVLTARFAV